MGYALLIILLLGIVIFGSIIGYLIYIFYKKRRNYIISILVELYNEKENIVFTNINSLLSLDNYLTRKRKTIIENIFHNFKEKVISKSKICKNFVYKIENAQKETISIREICNNIEENLNLLKYYNQIYIQKQMEIHKDFFNGSEFNQSALNEQQIRAILTNDNYNLVVAGPGSGKTKLLTDRVAFYILKKGVKQEDILALAYNKSAAEEVNNRLENNYGIKTKIASTFHGFGFSVVSKNKKNKTDNVEVIGNKKGNIIKKIIEQSKADDSEFQDRFYEYINKYLSNIEFEDENTSDKCRKEALLRMQKGKEYEAMDGEKVKSFAEKEIANFFIKNGIKYKYEKNIEWHDSSEERIYHPDFYLTDYDIYLEHWTITSNEKIPDWYDKNIDEYLEERDWKLNQFEKHNKVLWETDHFLWKNGLLEEKLIELCQKSNVSLNPISNKELIKMIDKTVEDNYEVLLRSIKGAIESIKVNGFSYLEFIKYLNKIREKLNRREEAFFKLIIPILMKYENYLEKYKLIDYEDMVNKAYKLLENNDADNNNPKYKMILVDEFQDISRARLKLLKNLSEQVEDCRVFCVGDDWQSIYGFSGASNKYMLEFGKFVSYFEEIKLVKNFRNPQAIIDYGSQIIHQCTDYIDKDLISDKNRIENPIIIEKIDAVDEFDYNRKQMVKAYELIVKLLENGTKPSEIMILSRFNHGYSYLREKCMQNPKIDVEQLKEGECIKKGLRFYSIHKSKGLEAEHVIVLNLLNGTYGLPSEMVSPYNYHIINEDLSLPEDEEKRLFFVAITRAKSQIYFFTRSESESIFLDYII